MQIVYLISTESIFFAISVLLHFVDQTYIDCLATGQKLGADVFTTVNPRNNVLNIRFNRMSTVKAVLDLILLHCFKRFLEQLICQKVWVLRQREPIATKPHVQTCHTRRYIDMVARILPEHDSLSNFRL